MLELKHTYFFTFSVLITRDLIFFLGAAVGITRHNHTLHKQQIKYHTTGNQRKSKKFFHGTKYYYTMLNLFQILDQNFWDGLELLAHFLSVNNIIYRLGSGIFKKTFFKNFLLLSFPVNLLSVQFNKRLNLFAPEDDAERNGCRGEPARNSHLGVHARNPVRPTPKIFLKNIIFYSV